MKKVAMLSFPGRFDKYANSEAMLTDAGFEVVHVEYNENNPEKFISDLDGIDGVLTRAAIVIKPEIIKQLRTVKVFSITGVGFNYKMAEAAKEAGIMLAALRGFNAKEVADHSATLILALIRCLKRFDNAIQKDNAWKPLLCAGQIKRVEDLTIGLIGCGRIGGGVAQRMQGFGAKVIAYDPYLPKEVADKMNVELKSFDEVLAESDAITLHMNLTEENTNMIGKAEFEKMVKKPVFVNCSRGAMVVEKDLLYALDNGLISAAGLDVFLSEKPDFEKEYAPFLGRDNVIITPHAAFYSTTSERLSQELSVGNIVNALNGDFDKVEFVMNDVKSF